MQISQQGYPFTEGMKIPKHNSSEIEEADPANVLITYKLDGVTVATKLIAVVGTKTTITLTVV